MRSIHDKLRYKAVRRCTDIDKAGDEHAESGTVRVQRNGTEKQQHVRRVVSFDARLGHAADQSQSIFFWIENLQKYGNRLLSSKLCTSNKY